MLRLCRRIRHFMFRMYRWVNNWSFPEGIKRTFSVLFHYFVKVCLGLGVPLLAIRYVFKGRSVRRESGKQTTSDESSPSEKLEPLTEDQGTEDTEDQGTEDRGTEDQGTEDTEDQGTEDTEDQGTEDQGTEDQGTEDTEDQGTEEAATPVLESAFPVQKPATTYPTPEPPVSAQEPEQENSPDDYSCEYDSTWDTDTEVSQDQRPGGTAGAQGGKRKRTAHRLKNFRRQSFKFERFRAAAKDLQNYRHNYPDKSFQQWNIQDNENVHTNLDFYLGKRPSLPDNVYISDFHTAWRGKYDILESVHSYIQWLFPLQEPGVNFEASTLTKEEIEEFCHNDLAKKRLLESYKLMLDFYGIELCNEETGEVTRAQNWIDRFANLNRRTHNNLRITRILKCLGTLGFPHYQAPLVSFFLEETLVNGELQSVKDSVLNYFLFTVLDKKQRRSLLRFAYLKSDERDEFVWCPIKIQRKWVDKVSEHEAS